MEIESITLIGARRHGQGGAPPENVEKLLQMLSKTSVDKVFMHHFEKMSSASGGFAPRPHRAAAPGSCHGIPSFRLPNCPPLEKILRAPMVTLAVNFNYVIASVLALRRTHRGSTGPAEHLVRTTARPIWPPLISL